MAGNKQVVNTALGRYKCVLCPPDILTPPRANSPPPGWDGDNGEGWSGCTFVKQLVGPPSSREVGPHITMSHDCNYLLTAPEECAQSS